jgi:hypothetical protein
MNQTLRNVLLFVGALVIAGIALAFVDVGKDQTIDLTALARSVDAGEVERMIVRGSAIEVTKKDGTELKAQKESGESLSELLNNYGVSSEKIRAVTIDVKDGGGVGYWAGAILPTVGSSCARCKVRTTKP